MSISKAEKAEALKYHDDSLEYLRKILKPGSSVTTITAHRVRSNMASHETVLAIIDGKIVNISGSVSNVLFWKWSDYGAVVVNGCGLNRGHHLVMQLSYALHGKDSVGIVSREKFIREPTDNKYVAGYSLIHNQL